MNKINSICFPPDFKLICLKKNKKNIFYFYNNMYFYKFSLDFYYFDEQLNCVLFINTGLKNNQKYSNFFSKFMKSLNCYFFIKIKFKGKGYKIKYSKKKKRIKFFFGRSHITIVKYRGVILKKNSKYKFVIKSNNLEIVKKNAKITTNVKPINIFTLRGIKESRGTVYKRKGKKGSYI